ncbi:IclR family transcriptional regulator [Actinocrinis puniceicyclus]|uniref:Glycerol operon regulatory protein n=1 Tax=Actinocrinis puniceicyclus TaxID=977794 RepID=A0A8J7WIV1_9ACTN|nr:IclR family transcriptional regulator [Actinocrinis puniceicyclus]MBS2963026.1 IclR family transcriptional regulator [Actinocrinis puniceicyclus]
MPEPLSAPSRDGAGPFVQSLERGLAVIRAFDAEHPELTLSEVARTTGLTRAAARRFLLTLVELGYVRTDGRLFALRPKILELGYAYLSSLSLPEIALPHLEQLVERVHESTSVSVLDGDEVVYVARVPTKRIMTVAISVGTRFPAYATSMGRVLLAWHSAEWLDGYLASAKLRALTSHTLADSEVLRQELAAVRERGWAMADQELEEGLRSVAAPIRDQSGQVVAAINVATNVSRTSAQDLVDRIVPHMLETAALIEQDLARSTVAQRSGLRAQRSVSRQPALRP